MALTPLAASVDLLARNISVPKEMDGDAILAAVSDAVRDAAGCAISQATSTVTLVATDYDNLDLPAGPVTAVTSVTVAGEPVVGWELFGDTIAMPCDWTTRLPVNVTVTYTHGYATVPADIVDLVCSMAAMAFAQNGDYGTTGRLEAVRLGDYSEKYQIAPGTESPSPIALPDRVREQLRARFNTSVAVVRVRK